MEIARDMKSLYVLSNGASCRPTAYRSIMRVVVDQSSLHRSAVLRIGVLRPGIFLLAGVGLERDLLVLFGEPKLAWFVSTTGAS